MTTSERDQALAEIRRGVEVYCAETYDFRFRPNEPVVRLHEPTFGAEEINAIIEVLLSTRVTQGPKVKAFEAAFSEACGARHSVVNNSGSSANLLGIAAVANVKTENGLRPGDEVLVPALSWSTTVWPLVQLGLVPVVVDIDPKTLNVDVEQLERAIGPKTRGVLLVHVYGNPCEMDQIVSLCKDRDLILMEDCCEALGARYKNTPVGRFGRFGTFSFYFSHHIATLEGGVVITDDFELSELMRILRSHGWVRDVEDAAPHLKGYEHVDPRFLFVNLGYNLRLTEPQAAMGLVQLPKLTGFVEKRRANIQAWHKDLANYRSILQFQQETPGGYCTYFGFTMIVDESAPFTAQELSKALKQANIETRPIICGNVAAQPGLQLYPHRAVGDLAQANRVMARGLAIGNHQAIDDAARGYVVETIHHFMRDRGVS